MLEDTLLLLACFCFVTFFFPKTVSRFLNDSRRGFDWGSSGRGAFKFSLLDRTGALYAGVALGAPCLLRWLVFEFEVDS